MSTAAGSSRCSVAGSSCSRVGLMPRMGLGNHHPEGLLDALRDAAAT
ncbi:hypothetical protein J7E96_33175 [Streptomyces sp. ISL-96]|nr:hypothetical protein [Streptomyces sp. ISL-96]MBT2493268.1 hypothetical protein [Streptomyces sp. ISL-96]